MKRVIVISTSLRRGSNSDMLADKFVEGAIAAGNEVEKISLSDKNIQFCKGCLGCHKLGRCVINDDVNDIMAKVYSIRCFTTYEQIALNIFTIAISPIIIHSVADSFRYGNNLYPTAMTNTKSAKLSNLAPNLLSTPHLLARKPSSMSVKPAVT